MISGMKAKFSMTKRSTLVPTFIVIGWLGEGKAVPENRNWDNIEK
jgi:hypothetical protein